MKINLRSLPQILTMATLLLVVGTWAYISRGQVEIGERSSPETTFGRPTPPATSATTEDIPLMASNNSVIPAVAPVESPAPEAEDRIPGTTLSQKILDDLGIEEPLNEEQVFYATATPNDTIYPQWYTTAIEAPAAWDTTTGSSSTLIAVIDTGFALGHEDLSPAWFINAGEQGNTVSGDTCWTGTPANRQTNACDDDSNGYIDDWKGWDFSNADNSPQAGDNYAPGATHGTKSSGLVGARGNNSVGVASINWQTKLLPLQALFDQGFGYSSDITAAIYYAVDMGADVINMSLGGPSPDSFTRAAVQYALANNVIVIASSGNCGLNQTDPQCIGYPSPGGMGYPARYPETIAVGATTSTDAIASFSSWGDEVDIAAPGSGTIQTPSWSTTNGTNLYASSSFGTSFSAPIVAGAVGLLKAEYPDITKDEVIALMSDSSDKVAGMGGADWTQMFGWGRLNVNNLLTELVEYQRQLLKAGGNIEAQTTSNKPQISSNTGHTSTSAITGSSTVSTVCVTVPKTMCSMKLDKQGSSTVVNFDAIRANNQGIAIFNWTKSDASIGTWDATVTSGAQTSNVEQLIIQ